MVATLGRAGRRNRDPFGLCILMIDIEQDMESVKALVKEASDPLVLFAVSKSRHDIQMLFGAGFAVSTVV